MDSNEPQENFTMFDGDIHAGKVTQKIPASSVVVGTLGTLFTLGALIALAAINLEACNDMACKMSHLMNSSIASLGLIMGPMLLVSAVWNVRRAQRIAELEAKKIHDLLG
jgi:protein-S-isoprenylcysteine O-methyltransferase Ste14